MRQAQAPARPVSLLVYHRDGAERVPLRAGAPVVVGRDVTADVSVGDHSLSRQHARFSIEDGAVVVEDLGSTNGTWIGGERVTRDVLRPGQEVTLGSVTVSAHVHTRSESKLGGLEGDDRFRSLLEAEISRARFFGRKLALVMARSARAENGHLSRWHPRVQALLRPVDRAALYSADAAEILMPELGADDAAAVADRIVSGARPGEPPLRCGVAVFPDAATTAEELVFQAGAALRRATPERPVQRAPAEGAKTLGPAPLEDSDAEHRPIVQSPAMREVWETAVRLARTAIPVLLLGETGVGKEIVARAIHEQGPRRERPMVAVNCAAIAASLLESTLFGHERGAFTGASQQQKGVFEAAHGGTVLLDEIGELPSPAQAALLRVLETKRLARVGSNREIEVDVRVVAATHRDLEAMCDAGSFRFDLLYRLNGITLAIPPLRDRPEEIEPLALRFLREANEVNGCDVRTLAPDALAKLESYRWPGNVRELKNAIERAVVIAQGGIVTIADLPERVRASGAVRAGSAPSPEPDPALEGDLRSRLTRFETEVIVAELRKADGNQTEAARRLGLPLRTLVHKIKALGIKKLYAR